MTSAGTTRVMNTHEQIAWRVLLYLGARPIELGRKHALDLTPIRITSQKNLRLFCQAVVDVAGRSGANRRHQDRAGCPVYVVTDDAQAAVRIGRRVLEGLAG